MKNFQRYIAFLKDYDALLKSVLADQRQMLAAVTGGKLEEIRHSMNATQANTMRLEQLEAQRQAIQAAEGLENLGIRGVAEQLSPKESAELLPLCDGIDATVREIKFVEEKAKGMAQCNLAEMDPSLLEGILAQAEEGARENPYEKLRWAAANRPAMEAKA